MAAYVIVVPIAIVERLLGREATLGLTLVHRHIRITDFFYRLATNIILDVENRAPEGSVVVISNHHSLADIYLILHAYPRIHFSARRTLFRIPFLGWAMAILGHFPHRAEDPSGALTVAEEWIRRGRYVGIFPEGTRAPGGVIKSFHPGAFRLAQRTTGRVQPIVIAGTDRVWAKGQRWIRQLGPVKMRILPPMEVPASLGRTQLLARIEEIRSAMMEEHGRLERDLFG